MALAAAAAGRVTVSPVAEGEAVVTVTATDLQGLSRTAAQTFMVTVACAFAVDPLHRDVLWTAGAGQVAVATGPGCAWTATSGSAFLTVTAGSAGTGAGVVAYTVAQNAGGPRTGILTVAGQHVTVFQASPTAFADHPIRPGATPVRAIHFLELRARIDALRVREGLAGFGWTDPTLTAGATPVRLVHLAELRAALAEVYAASGRAAPSYTDAALTAERTVIRVEHLMELRAAVAALE